jgi:hypothetical protein
MNCADLKNQNKYLQNQKIEKLYHTRFLYEEFNEKHKLKN